MKKILSVFLALILAFSCLAVFGSAASFEEAEMPFENSAFFEDGDYTLHYRTYGNRLLNRSKIMLFHGFGLSTESLDGIATEYENAGYYVVTVDMPNFGYSSRETESTALVSREELAFELMEALGGNWILGGHSMGGGIAVNIAVNHPEKVKGLVLFAPQTSVKAQGFVSSFMKSKLMRSVFGSLIGLAAACPFLVRPLVSLSFSDDDFAKNYDVSKITAPLSVPGTGAGMAVMSSHTQGTDFEAFSALEIPVVFVTAENDKVANAKNLEKLISSAPQGAVVEKVSAGGHMMMEYDPANTASLTLPVIQTMR